MLHTAFFRRFPFLILLLSALPGAAFAQTPGDGAYDFAGRAAPLSRAQLRLRLQETRALKVQSEGNRALFDFKCEQAELALGDKYYDSETSRRHARQLIDRARDIARATDDASKIDVLKYVYEGDFGSPQTAMHERAYRATNDGSAQPFWIYLPREYSAKKKYPLAVFLHGYDPQIDKLRPFLPPPSLVRLANQRGFIVAVPYGRRNSDFLGIGEDDVLRVLDETQRLYNIDETRIFLTGVSMGGFGTLAVGLKYPHRFAALAPMAARTDIYRWLRLQPETLPAWKRFLHEADDPRHLVKNARNLPIFLQHGVRDTLIPLEHARLLRDDLRALKYAVQLHESDDEHAFYFAPAPSQRAFDWLEKQPPQSAPRKIVFTTGSLKNARAYWAQIAAFSEYSAPATLQVELRGARLEVKTQNVAAFRLDVPRELRGATKKFELIVNGKSAGRFEAALPIRWPQVPNEKSLSTQKAQKTPEVCGPIREVYRAPFLLVYGTRGAQSSKYPATETLFVEMTQDEANARRFAREWQEFADGTPPLKADTEITPADEKNFNLILFGDRRSNAILARIADQLPLELTPDGYRFGQQKIVAPDIGLQFCYASPFAEKKTIAVHSGLYYGGALPLNHKFDLLPDYIVFQSALDTDQTNSALRAGFFDHFWQLP